MHFLLFSVSCFIIKVLCVTINELHYFQTQASLLEAVVEMNSRQTNVERRADNIENSLRGLQVCTL